MAQLEVSLLLSTHKTGLLSPGLCKPGEMVHACNPGTREMENFKVTGGRIGTD